MIVLLTNRELNLPFDSYSSCCQKVHQHICIFPSERSVMTKRKIAKYDRNHSQTRLLTTFPVDALIRRVFVDPVTKQVPKPLCTPFIARSCIGPHKIENKSKPADFPDCLDVSVAKLVDFAEMNITGGGLSCDWVYEPIRYMSKFLIRP